jgi:hypothetical protein
MLSTTAFVLLLGAVIACSSSGAPSNRLLESLLNAPTDKEKRDTLWLHFFNDLALFTAPDPLITKLLLALARGQNTLRDDALSFFSRWVWSKHLDPKPEVVQMCVDEIRKGNLSTDPRRKPEPSEEQNDCEIMFSFMNNGKNPIDDFAGRIRGKDAVEFAER